MVLRSSAFVPESLLAAPRRSPGIPNSDGSFVVYKVSSYSFSSHEQTSEVRVLNTSTSESALLDGSKEASNPVWLNNDTLALLRGTEEEKTQLIVGNVHNFKESSYVAGVIESTVDNLKVVELKPNYYGIAITASANPDGSLYSSKAAKKRYTTGRLYSTLFVRHWDKYLDRQRNTIWYGTLSKQEDSKEDTPKLYMSTLVNALKDTSIECPIPPFGGTDDFDIGKQGLIFIAKDPSLDPARNTKCNFYHVPLNSFHENPPKLVTINSESMKGAMSSPVFSPSGDSAVFLAMRQNGYESDKNHVFYIPDITKLTEVVHLLSSSDGKGRWDRSPTTAKFSVDGLALYVAVDNIGRKQLFRLPIRLSDPGQLPVCLTEDGSVSDFHALRNHKSEQLFISSTSLVESSLYSTLTIDANTTGGRGDTVLCEISSMTRAGAMFGLSRAQVREFWFNGFDKATKSSYKVHSWMVVPSAFDESQTYPLALLVHGGPQSAWSDAWSTRWNPALFAEQGYVVVLPNLTGSTGYGQAFTDAIQEQWGGRPYEDLVKCFESVEKLPFIDIERAVALGASYGGYMMNWVQGQPLGRRLKALVTHDGVFSVSYELATDELYFIDHDIGGYKPNSKIWQKWDPVRFMDNWSTPHLVIHSDRDFRLSVADGLATFNMLQVRGVESQFLNFPDENHFVLKPENSLVWHETVFNFINKHVDLPLCNSIDDKHVVQDPERGTVMPVEQYACISFS